MGLGVSWNYLDQGTEAQGSEKKVVILNLIALNGPQVQLPIGLVNLSHTLFQPKLE